MDSQEEHLVQRAQRGDRSAFAALYQIYFDRIYRYVAIHLGNQSDAEDITQQVFLNAMESIASFKWRDTSLAPWLFRIARNQVIDHIRKKARRGGVFPLGNNPTHGADPAELVGKKMEWEALKSVLGRLTDAQQGVIALRFISDLSIAETAKTLDKTEGAVKALQHSGLLAVRRLLAGPTSPTSVMGD